MATNVLIVPTLCPRTTAQEANAFVVILAACTLCRRALRLVCIVVVTQISVPRSGVRSLRDRSPLRPLRLAPARRT